MGVCWLFWISLLSLATLYSNPVTADACVPQDSQYAVLNGGFEVESYDGTYPKALPWDNYYQCYQTYAPDSGRPSHTGDYNVYVKFYPRVIFAEIK